MPAASLGEFGRIRRFMAPLAAGMPAALGLSDDAALVAVPEGRHLVVTVDAMVEAVHFLPSDPPDLIARKLLRVNLSDLAAMGAIPYGYLLSMALPARCEDAWVERFAAGLAQDQAEFGIGLLGGDSVSTAGPISLSLTAFGLVAAGSAIRRSGARPGDLVFVSGTIGDGALGLLAATYRLSGVDAVEAAYLADRYRVPQPRTKLGPALIGLATAMLDVSDGLVGDCGHIADASDVAITLEAAAVPISAAAASALAEDVGLMAAVLTGGDDYELLFTAPPAAEAAIRALGLAVTRIGRVSAGSGVRILDRDGHEMRFAQTGFRHV